MTLLCLPWPFGLVFNLERECRGFDRFLVHYAERYVYVAVQVSRAHNQRR